MLGIWCFPHICIDQSAPLGDISVGLNTMEACRLLIFWGPLTNYLQKVFDFTNCNKSFLQSPYKIHGPKAGAYSVVWVNPSLGDATKIFYFCFYFPEHFLGQPEVLNEIKNPVWIGIRTHDHWAGRQGF